MKDPMNVLAVLVLLLIFCAAPVMIIAMVVYAFAFKVPRKKEELAQLAEQMGLRAVDDPRYGRLYVGTYQNHNFNLGFGAREY
jgi:hypothetical protein